MRENRPSGSEGGARSIPCPYPYLCMANHPDLVPKPFAIEPECARLKRRSAGKESRLNLFPNER